MKQSISSTWSLQVVIFFILIFAAFLTLVIQYSKAYRVKNEVLTILEKYEGLSTTSRDVIANYLANQSYNTYGSCNTDEEGWYGAIDKESFEKAKKGEKYLFCIKENELCARRDKETSKCKSYKYYYNVTFFYKFHLPVLGELNTFSVAGKTKTFLGVDKKNRLLAFEGGINERNYIK